MPTRIIIYRGFVIHRVVARIAYARNGNVGNPTIEYNWEVRDAHGVLIDRCVMLRVAKAFIDEMMGVGF